jgi:ribosomal protein S18 acetylase RimI-like enzyme
MQLPIQTTLKDGTAIELGEMNADEKETVKTLLNLIVSEGQTYPQAQPLNEAEFAAYWMVRDTFVVREWNDLEDHSGRNKNTGKVLGAFYLKPNFPGRCSHICNAGFIVQPAARGLGIGRYMGENMLTIARERGYSAVMFNLIFATNTPSLNLWKSLGFSVLGIIPNAVRFDDQTIDAVMMYRDLAN